MPESAPPLVEDEEEEGSDEDSPPGSPSANKRTQSAQMAGRPLSSNQVRTEPVVAGNPALLSVTSHVLDLVSSLVHGVCDIGIVCVSVHVSLCVRM